jgi:hypothetical protein
LFLYTGNMIPVSFTFIHLCTCSCMDSQCFNTGFLQSFSYLININRFRIPASLVFTVTGRWVEFTTALVRRTIRSISFNTPAPAPLHTTFLPDNQS